MGGFNPRAPMEVKARIRELEQLARKHRREQVELDKTIALFKKLLKELTTKNA